MAGYGARPTSPNSAPRPGHLQAVAMSTATVLLGPAGVAILSGVATTAVGLVLVAPRTHRLVGEPVSGDAWAAGRGVGRRFSGAAGLTSRGRAIHRATGVPR